MYPKLPSGLSQGVEGCSESEVALTNTFSAHGVCNGERFNQPITGVVVSASTVDRISIHIGVIAGDAVCIGGRGFNASNKRMWHLGAFEFI